MYFIYLFRLHLILNHATEIKWLNEAIQLNKPVTFSSISLKVNLLHCCVDGSIASNIYRRSLISYGYTVRKCWLQDNSSVRTQQCRIDGCSVHALTDGVHMWIINSGFHIEIGTLSCWYGKVVPVLNYLSTTPRRRMGMWNHRSTFSWPRH
jgi:hypothetical protein